MKRAAVMWTGLLLAALLCACGSGGVSGTVVDCGESELYGQEDLEAAAEAVLRGFEADFDGCVLHTLEYAGDDVSAQELEYCRSLDGERDFTECAVFESSFHSPESGGGTWEADREYTGWSWHVAREDGGEWTLLAGGYA